jgi:hypothetical protein
MSRDRRSSPATTRSIASSKSVISTAFLFVARGSERGLVDQVREVGAHETGVARRQGREVDIGRQRDAARVDLEDHLAAPEIRAIDHDLAVEATGTHERGIEDLGPVRGGHDDHALARVEAVQLGQKLIERLLPLVVSAEAGAIPRALPSASSSSMKMMLGALACACAKQVAHAGGTDADEHLDEVRAVHAEERHARLTGHGLCQQRLAGTRARPRAARPWGSCRPAADSAGDS